MTTKAQGILSNLPAAMVSDYPQGNRKWVCVQSPQGMVMGMGIRIHISIYGQMLALGWLLVTVYAAKAFRTMAGRDHRASDLFS